MDIVGNFWLKYSCKAGEETLQYCEAKWGAEGRGYLPGQLTTGCGYLVHCGSCHLVHAAVFGPTILLHAATLLRY